MMTSCWRGIGHFLGECVPYHTTPTDSSRRTRSNSSHVAPAHDSPSISSSSPRVSRPSTGATQVSTRVSDRAVTATSEGSRFLVVRPASPRTRLRTTSPRINQYRRSSQGLSSSPADFGLYSQRRASSRAGAPLMVLARGFQLPPIPSTDSNRSFLYSYGFKCPVCSKLVLADDLECHLVICLTKPRISYNEDVLSEDKGECVICLDELSQGDTIARLPCLCIYHKTCIDEWFQVNRSCPEHPYD